MYERNIRIMGRLFGTDGARGVAITELTCEMGNADRPCRCIGADKRGKAPCEDFHRQGHPHFLRYSGSGSLCRHLFGRSRSGKLGVVPTPAVAYLVRTHGADAGVMISASHNSVEFNGIKLFAATGYKLPDAIEAEIEALILDHPEQITLQSGTGSRCHFGITLTPRKTIFLIWQAVLPQTVPACVWFWTVPTAVPPQRQNPCSLVWVQRYICSVHHRTAPISIRTAAPPTWKPDGICKDPRVRSGSGI